MFEIMILLLAGVISGVFNAIAGGGSLISFPALVFVGIPPIIANATNTYASCAGYLSGAFAFKKELAKHKRDVIILCLIGLVGGMTGGWLLLQVDTSQFDGMVPWLLLFATLLFICGDRLNTLLKHYFQNHTKHSILASVLGGLSFLLVCIYGGFFNAGLGIILLSTLAITGYTNINLMNGIKLVISAVVLFFSTMT